MPTETSGSRANGLLYVSGRRTKESNRTLGQFLRTRLGREAFQRRESRPDSRVKGRGRRTASDPGLGLRRLFRAGPAEPIVKYEFSLVSVERTHGVPRTPGAHVPFW